MQKRGDVSEAALPIHGVSAAREALELPTSTVNPCVLSIVIAKLSQHLTDLNKKAPPQFRGGSLRFRRRAMILCVFCFIFKQNHLFICGLDSTRTCDLTDVNGASNPLQGASRPTELQDLALFYLQYLHCVQYVHTV